jgi:hypothetical protein
MWFPPEILAIIREYYQPCFKYGILYKRILKLSRFREWPKLKEVLQSNPNKIMPFLLEYEKAQVEWLKVAFRQPYTNKYEDEWYNCKLSIRDRTYRTFVQALNDNKIELNYDDA